MDIISGESDPWAKMASGRLEEVGCPSSHRAETALIFRSLPSQFHIPSISLGRFLNKGESWRVSQSGGGGGGGDGALRHSGTASPCYQLGKG